MLYRFFVLLTMLLSFALTGQDRSYTNQSAAAKKSGRGIPIKNTAEYTFEGDFLRRAAADNAFLLEISKAAKLQGSSNVRTIAGELVSGEGKLGEEIRKLAARKHITLPDTLTEADNAAKQRMESLSAEDLDQFFTEQALLRYRIEIISFETEAKQGIDLDIKKWAADELGRLERHQKLAGSPARRAAGDH